MRLPPSSTLFPYTTLFRSGSSRQTRSAKRADRYHCPLVLHLEPWSRRAPDRLIASRNAPQGSDRKSTRLNSSHLVISYAVFCLKKKIKKSKGQSALINQYI